MFNPGDILFYSSSGSFFDNVITLVEGDPHDYVHVAIAISGLQKIEALARGIVLTQIQPTLVRDVWSYMDRAHPYIDINLHNALNWLINQKGNLYGWEDTFNALLARGGLDFSINVCDEHDCSGLACQFLQIAGGVPQLIGYDCHKITPQQLYNTLSTGNRLP